LKKSANSRLIGDFIEQVGVVVQEFKQVGDRLQGFCLPTLVAGKCISPSPGDQRRFLLRQLEFLTYSCKFSRYPCIDFLGALFDGLGKANTFARVEFNFPAVLGDILK
jgi:hypothetical protein